MSTTLNKSVEKEQLHQKDIFLFNEAPSSRGTDELVNPSIIKDMTTLTDTQERNVTEASNMFASEKEIYTKQEFFEQGFSEEDWLELLECCAPIMDLHKEEG